MTGESLRRELGAAILGCLTGAAAVLLAGGAIWGRVDLMIGESIPVVPVELSGRQVAPLAASLGLLGLAAAAALVATRGWVRRGLGVLVGLSGVAVVVDTLRAGDRVTALAVETSPGAVAGDPTATAWPWLAVVGGILLFGAGLVTLWRGGHWRAMSKRYEAPRADREQATPRTGATADPEAAWRALDRGEDPTV